MNNNRRIEKVASLIKRELSQILMYDLCEVSVLDDFVSITKVDISKDLQYCKVYISTSEVKTSDDYVIDNLNSVKNKIRHLLSKRIDMRRMPEIVFKRDKVLDKGLSVLKLLDDIKLENQHKKFRGEDESK